MAKGLNRIALYELVNKARFKSAQQKALAAVEYRKTGQIPAETVEVKPEPVVETPVVDSPAPAKRRIGLVCGADNSFYQMLTAEDNMRFFAGLYGVRSEAMEERIEELFEGLGLTDAGKESFGHLSSGMRQRLALARAMVSLPGVLLVDEASRSLDEDSAAKVSAYIKEYAGDNEAACVVVTHDRSWAKKYSIRSGTLVDGKIRTEITQ